MDLINLLQAHLQKQFPTWQEVTIQELEVLPDGWESDLYTFTFSYIQDGISHS